MSVPATVAVSSAAAQGVQYTEGETYYRHKETGVLYGKGMVQSNWLPPELEEMIATDTQTLVPVKNARAQVAGTVVTTPKPRRPPRSVPRFDAPASALAYQYNPQDPKVIGHVREPDAETAAKAAKQAERYAAERVRNSQEQLDAITRREQAELDAAAQHAQKVASVAETARVAMPEFPPLDLAGLGGAPDAGQ